MANGYGEWMNNLSGMTSALGAASPYAQQLASQNAAQMALASQIRSGLPAAVASGYAPSPVAGGVVGGTYQVPQPAPFTGFADLIAANRAVRLSPQPYPNPPVVSGGVTSTGEQRDEGPSFAPYEGGYGSIGEWWDVMKGLPQFASQFTPAGIANQVYQQEFGFKPTTTWDAITTGYGPENRRAPTPPAGMVEILSRSPNALSLGETYPIPEVGTEQLGLLYEPTARDEIIQQAQDENDWRNEGWWQDEDSGTWYRG
jgi:hypothetical protein